MRVLFLTLYPHLAASPRYRVHQFLPYLERRGIRAAVASAVSLRAWQRAQAGLARFGRISYHAAEGFRRVRHALEASSYDIVVVQKAMATIYWKGLGELIRRRSKRLVLDIDDAVHLHAPVSPGRWYRSLTAEDEVRGLFASADLVLAGNHWLVRQASEAGGDACYFPTVVDTAYWTPPAEPPKDFKAAWIGSPSTAGYLDALGSAFTEQTGVELICYGAQAPPLPGAQARPWRLETEVDDLRQCAAGVMPLPQTPWARGKCALKALQYMACGMPCIATPFGAAQHVISAGVDGLYARTPEEWVAQAALLKHSAFRGAMGALARDTIETRFSLDLAAPKLAGHFERLMDTS